MAAEGAIAIAAAVLAGSVALLGLGFDSLIEGAGSIIIIMWRFSGTRTLSATAERRAQQAVAMCWPSGPRRHGDPSRAGLLIVPCFNTRELHSTAPFTSLRAHTLTSPCGEQTRRCLL